MKKIWIIIAAIAVLVGGAILYVALSDNDMPFSQNTTSRESSNPGNGATDPQTGDSGAAGRYTDYAAEAVANTDGRKWLFFHAPWCPQCRALEADIQNSSLPAGLTVFKVDYDSSTQLKQKYGVTLQTTIVEIDDQGNEVKKFVAYDDPSLGAVLAALGR